jgi:peptidoglycan hydrolase CwlO-like protein
MEKKAQIVGFLVLIGLSGLFSIEVFADSNNTYMDKRIQSANDTISEYEASGSIPPNEAEQLRLEVGAVQQDKENAILPMFPAKEAQINAELDKVEQDIQNAAAQ